MLVRQRIIVITLVGWLPLLVLSAVEGQLLGGKATVPFLLDLEVHVRFLVALPLLIAAELVVHHGLRSVVKVFLERHLIPESAKARFDAAITSAFRLRNSVFAELLLIALVYGVGVLIVWRHVHGARHEHVVRDAVRGRLEAFARRDVVWLREPADLPVPAVPLVFPASHLDTVSLAGLPHQVETASRSSRSARRPGISLQHGVRL